MITVQKLYNFLYISNAPCTNAHLFILYTVQWVYSECWKSTGAITS